MDEHTQALILQAVGILTLAMPALEKIVSMTKTKVDDEILNVVEKILSFVPRVRLGGK